MMQSITQPVLVFGQVEVHLEDLWIRNGAGRRDELTPTEARLLGRLAMEMGAPVERDVLLTDVWAYHPNTQTRTIDATVRRLRTKIERDPASPEHLLTVRGQGYRLVLGESASERVEPVRATPLPVVSGEIVGRSDLLEAMEQALSLEQVVTLVGPPGVGKTRMALEWARTRARGDGLCVDLTGIATVQEAVIQVARTLNLPLLSSAGVEDHPAIVGRCLGRSGLGWLLLDNVEQLDGLAMVVRAWCSKSPDLKMVLTSRRRFGRMPGRITTVGALAVSDAVDLFCERAGLDASGAMRSDAVTEIVARLDHMPLAILLAADRVSLLGLEGLKQRLDRPLELIGGTSDGHGLRAALETSWSLMSDEQRIVLAWCSVFQGAWNVPLLEAIMEDVASTLDWMTALAELQANSMIQSRDPSVGSLYLLEVIRQFALEQAEAMGIESLARSRFSRVVVEWAERWSQQIEPAQTLVAQRHLLSQSTNLQWALTLEQEPEWTLRLARVLEPVLEAAGPYTILIDVFERAIERVGGSVQADTVDLFARRGWAFRRQGQMEAARRDAETVLTWAKENNHAQMRVEGLTLLGGVARRQGLLQEAETCFLKAISHCADKRAEAVAWAGLGTVYSNANRLAEANAAFEQALSKHRGDWRLAASVQIDQGLLHRRLGRWDTARHFIQAGIALYESAGLTLDAARAKGSLGLIEIEAGQQARAERLLGEAQRVLKQAQDRRSEGQILGWLAVLYRRQARFFEAESCLRQALMAHRETRNRPSEAGCENNLALLCIDRGRLEHASVHLEHARAIYRDVEDRRSEMIALVNQASVDLEQDRTEVARAALQSLCVEASEIGDQPLAGVCWLNYGLACHLSGAVEEARSAYGRAIRAAGRAVEGLDAKMFGALAMLEMGQRDQAIQWLADVRGALGRGKYPVRDAMLDLCDQRLSGVIHSELAEPHLAEHLQYSQDLRFARRLVTM